MLTINKTFSYHIPRNSLYGKLLEKMCEQRDIVALFHRAEKLDFSIAAKRLARMVLMNSSPDNHRCYRNDDFYLSHKYSLSSRQNACDLISNALLGYFERKTHAQFNLARLLLNEGIITEEDIIDNPRTSYSFLSKKGINEIAKRYKITEAEIEWIAFELLFAVLSRKNTAESYLFKKIINAQASSDMVISHLVNFVKDDTLLFVEKKFNVSLTNSLT